MFNSKLKKEVETLGEIIFQLDKKVENLEKELHALKVNDCFLAYYRKRFNNILTKKYKQAVQIITSNKIKVSYEEGYMMFKFNNLTIRTRYHTMEPFFRSKDVYSGQLGDFEFPPKQAEELFNLCQKYEDER